MTPYKLFKLVSRRAGTSVTLPPIHPTLDFELTYLRLLRKILRILRSQVIEFILPEAIQEVERAKAMKADVDQSSFEQLNRLGESLANTALNDLRLTIDREGKRHTKSFIQRVRSSLGVDLSAVVREEDLAGLLDTVAQRNVALIRGLTQDVARRIQLTVTQSVLMGRSRADLAKLLAQDFGFGDSRAKLIASDQASKLNSELNQVRHQQAGVEKYTWRTSHDERVRARHRALDGKVYKYGEATGAEGGLPPGQPIRCRCQALALVEF